MRKKKLIFSKRVELVNTLSVIIPLSILITFISISSLRRQLEISKENALNTLTSNVEQIYDKIDTFTRIENMINSNEALRIFFVSPEGYSIDEIVDIVKGQSLELENITTVTPYLNSVRLFPVNPLIPERWPSIISPQRLPDSDKSYWNFNYNTNYLGYMTVLREESLCSTRILYKNYKLIGYLQISSKMQDFFSSVYNNKDPDQEEFIFKVESYGMDFTLNNITNRTLLKINPELSEKNKAEVTKLIKKSRKNGQIKGVESLDHWYKIIAWHYIPEMRIYMVHYDKGSKLLVEVIHDLVIALSGLLVLTLLLSRFTKFITNKMLSGMYLIMDGMKKVQSGDFSVQIPVTGMDELNETQRTFNSMTKQLTEQIAQIKIEQHLIADTEMKALQNQINAHFLYNVLETIRMQAVLAGQDDVSESLQVLGKMMHYCLRWRVHKVPLSQEIEYTYSYVYLLNIRNDYKISLDIDIDQQFMDFEVPKMTLQPLVENAFVHSIEATDSDATIRIFVKISDDKKRFLLSVEDFGCGMNSETLQNLRNYLSNDDYERDSKGGIGLKNIQQRLTVFYGSEYRIQIDSVEGEGTTICVPIPYERKSR